VKKTNISLTELTVTPVDTSGRQAFLVSLALTGAVIGLILPWLAAPVVSLRPGAYDLAEWLTLLPAVRLNTPLLLPALLLRLPWVAIGVAMALQYAQLRTASRIVLLMLLGGIATALVPPVNFFRGQFGDANYQQQFIVWLLFIAGVAVALGNGRCWLREWGTLTALVVALICGVAGIAWGKMLLERYGLAFDYAAGGLVYGVALAASFVLMFVNRGRQPIR
jgi:hypothetical protein